MPLSYDARSVFSLLSMKYMGSCPLNRKKQKIFKSMSIMQRIRKERRPTNRKSEVLFLSFSHDVFFFYSLRKVFSILPCIQFQYSPVVLCYFISMEGNIPWMFMEIMWEFSICLFCPIQSKYSHVCRGIFLMLFFCSIQS